MRSRIMAAYSAVPPASFSAVPVWRDAITAPM